MRQAWDEAAGYLGYCAQKPPEDVRCLMQRAFGELHDAPAPRMTIKEATCRIAGDEVWLDGHAFASRDLAQCLKGCDGALLLAATMGLAVDAAIARASIREMSYAVVLQACASAQLERFVQQKLEGIALQRLPQGQYITQRWAPGYGDFAFECQKPFLSLVAPPHKMGVSLTDSGMLVPTKSITAVVGVSPVPQPFAPSKCAYCTKIDCEFRKE